MKKLFLLIALIFAANTSHADALTNDLDGLLMKLDQRAAQELSNYEGQRAVAKVVGKVQTKKSRKPASYKKSKKKLKRNLAHVKMKKKKRHS